MDKETYSFNDLDWFVGIDKDNNITVFPLVYNQSKTKVKNLLDDSIYLFDKDCFSFILSSNNLKPMKQSIATSNNLGISIVSSLPGFSVFENVVYSPMDSIAIDSINHQRLTYPPAFQPYSIKEYYYEHILDKQYDKTKIVKMAQKMSKILTKEYKKEHLKQNESNER